MKPLRLIPRSDVPNWAIIPTLSKPTQKIPNRYPIETNIARNRKVIRDVTNSDRDPQMLNSMKKKSGSNRNSAMSFLLITNDWTLHEKSYSNQILIFFLFFNINNKDYMKFVDTYNMNIKCFVNPFCCQWFSLVCQPRPIQNLFGQQILIVIARCVPINVACQGLIIGIINTETHIFEDIFIAMSISLDLKTWVRF